MIRVYIADDNESVRKDLRTLLELIPLVEIVGEAKDIETLMIDFAQEAPDILILDMDFGRWEKVNKIPLIDFQESCDAIRQIKKNDPQIRIFVLTIHGYKEARDAAIIAGAEKFFVKGQDVDEIMEILAHQANQDR